MNTSFVITSNPKIDGFLNNRVFQHIAYWLGLLCFFGLFWAFRDFDYYKSFYNELVSLPVKMVVVYFILYVLMPRLLYKKRYFEFFCTLLTAMVAGGLVNHAIFVNFIYPDQPQIKLFSGDFGAFEIMHRIVDINTVLVIPLVVKLLKKWYKNQEDQQILVREKLEAELKFLKNQIHPHFLFNTLNSLYALIMQKSDMAGEVVVKLSDLLRYMLYEAKADSIALSKEIVNIKNYIALEKIRYGNRIDVSFHLSGDIGSKTIAPMLILPFVENSFKHSVANELDMGWVTIDLCVNANYFQLKIDNSISSNKHKTNDLDSGIGLENVYRRLELLYPDKYKLKIREEEDSYLVILRIQL